MGSLKEYADLFERLKLSELQVEEGDFKLLLKSRFCVESVADDGNINNGNGAGMTVNNSTEASQSWETQGFEKNGSSNGTGVEQVQIKSPLLGVFHNATENNKGWSIGDPVKAGEVLCIIEAMKMFNEIKVPEDGTVVQILVKDGDLVEYDQPLFILSKGE
jgi:acetyl-CoA carboxylase biotin carboxyl carrier protein